MRVQEAFLRWRARSLRISEGDGMGRAFVTCRARKPYTKAGIEAEGALGLPKQSFEPMLKGAPGIHFLAHLQK